jgi:hypothetical protein
LSFSISTPFKLSSDKALANSSYGSVGFEDCEEETPFFNASIFYSYTSI